jgi:hypothetical protein
MKFENFYKKINQEKLKHFLEKEKGLHYESKIMKIAFEEDALFSPDTLKLYRYHFVLFNCLYSLQSFYNAQQKYLHIHFMKIGLIDIPDKNKCRYYDENINDFCKCNCSDTYCDYHKDIFKSSLPDILSEKYFYLDKNNFYLLNEETLEAFFNGVWKIFNQYDKYKDSLEILKVDKDSTVNQIRRNFYKLAKETHPDLGGNDVKKFIRINNAYHFLLKLYSIKNN